MYRIKRVTNGEKTPASSFSHNGLSLITEQGVKCKDGLFAIAPEEPEALAGRGGLASYYSQPGIRDGLSHLDGNAQGSHSGPKEGLYTHHGGDVFRRVNVLQLSISHCCLPFFPDRCVLIYASSAHSTPTYTGERTGFTLKYSKLPADDLSFLVPHSFSNFPQNPTQGAHI